MGRATVPEQVTTPGPRYLRGLHGFADPVAQIVGTEPLPVATEEQGLFGGIEQKAGAGFLQVAGEPMQGTLPDGNHPILVPFSMNR